MHPALYILRIMNRYNINTTNTSSNYCRVMRDNLSGITKESLVSKIKKEFNMKYIFDNLKDIYREMGVIYIQITQDFTEKKELLKKIVKLVYDYKEFFFPVKEGYKRYTREKHGYARKSGHPIKLDIV